MTTLGIYKLETRIQNYDWGSETFLSRLRGEPRSAEPEAELWIGVHEAAPSKVELSGQSIPLADLIAAFPREVLGVGARERFGSRLPFLLKILAIDKPLSVQLHPSGRAAREGLAREIERDLDPSERNYRDDRHKPELAVALTDFSALRGVLPPFQILELLDRARLEALGPETDDLAARPTRAGVESFLDAVFRLDERRSALVLADAHDASVRYRGEPIFDWVGRLLETYPEDIGCIAPLFMRLYELRPGQALYQPPGMLHAYMEGAAVEVMADSDNVLRAAMTSKRVDVDELMKQLVIETHEEPKVEAHDRDGLLLYASPADEFDLARLDLAPGQPYQSSPGRSIELWVCVGGEATLRATGLPYAVEVRGCDAVVVPAAVESYEIEGEATLFRASVPDVAARL